jgi:hypothetical protein
VVARGLWTCNSLSVTSTDDLAQDRVREDAGRQVARLGSDGQSSARREEGDFGVIAASACRRTVDAVPTKEESPLVACEKRAANFLRGAFALPLLCQ